MKFRKAHSDTRNGTCRSRLVFKRCEQLPNVPASFPTTTFHKFSQHDFLHHCSAFTSSLLAVGGPPGLDLVFAKNLAASTLETPDLRPEGRDPFPDWASLRTRNSPSDELRAPSLIFLFLPGPTPARILPLWKVFCKRGLHRIGVALTEIAAITRPKKRVLESALTPEM